MDIEHKAKRNGNMKSKVKSVKRFAGGAAPAPINPMVLFDLSAFDSVVYDGLTQWLKEKVAASPDYQALNGKAIDATGWQTRRCAIR